MGLRRTLRRAAGLLVELPPDAESFEEEEPVNSRTHLSAVQEVGKVYDSLELPEQSASPSAAKTVEQVVQEAEGPNLDQIQVSAGTLPPVLNADGTLNFAAIYQGARLPTAPFTAEQILEMIAALPAELPLDTRRQMVKISIQAMGKAIGATPETIVADASRKLAALAAYTDSLTHQVTELTTTAEREIAALQAQVEEKRRAVTAAQEKQARVMQACAAESDRLDDVLEFFTLDVPPSRYAAGKDAPPDAGRPG